MSEYILEISKLNKSFANVKVLRDVDLTLRKGSVLGLVGENGAGKSTMMNILGGVCRRSSGDIVLDGAPYCPNDPREAAKAGIAFIHQELNLFTNLTVSENMFLDNPRDTKAGFFSYGKIHQLSKEAMEKLGIEINVRTKMENLSMGERQMVEIAKAVTRDAQIVIFDEPTTSLSSKEKQKLFELIRELSAKNISMIYISHTLDDVMKLCDEVAVLRDGQIIAQRPVEQLTKDEIIAMMVGREMGNLYPYMDKTCGTDLLRVEGLNEGNVLKDISFFLKKGEIVGMFGLMGSGRSELARAIYGLDPIDSGCVAFDGKVVKRLNPIHWIDKGMAFITENRRDEGLLLSKSVKENLVLASLKNMKMKAGAMNFKKAECDSHEIVGKLAIKTYDKSRQCVGVLSGGNQQKVVIGKWLLRKPRVLMLDEPTRGVDVGAKYDIYTYMNDLAKSGAAILFISSEMEELMGICDRILIMSKGQIAGELPRCEYAQEKLIRLAIGGAV